MLEQKICTAASHNHSFQSYHTVLQARSHHSFPRDSQLWSILSYLHFRYFFIEGIWTASVATWWWPSTPSSSSSPTSSSLFSGALMENVFSKPKWQSEPKIHIVYNQNCHTWLLRIKPIIFLLSNFFHIKLNILIFFFLRSADGKCFFSKPSDMLN